MIWMNSQMVGSFPPTLQRDADILFPKETEQAAWRLLEELVQEWDPFWLIPLARAENTPSPSAALDRKLGSISRKKAERCTETEAERWGSHKEIYDSTRLQGTNQDEHHWEGWSTTSLGEPCPMWFPALSNVQFRAKSKGDNSVSYKETVQAASFSLAKWSLRGGVIILYKYIKGVNTRDREELFKLRKNIGTRTNRCKLMKNKFRLKKKKSSERLVFGIAK